MSVIVLLIVAGGVVAGGFLAAFVWAVSAGQYDDTHTPAVRVLLDDVSGDNFQLPTPNPQVATNSRKMLRGRLGVGGWRLGVDGVSRRKGSA